MEEEGDRRLWRDAGGAQLLWQEMCRISVHSAAEQSVVAQLLGDVLAENRACFSEATALLHILSTDPSSSPSSPSSSPSSSSSSSSPVLKSIKLPSPPQPPSAFLRLHAAKLNAYDIDDVLDSLRGALAQENVYLNGCITYLRKKSEELIESAYKKRSHGRSAKNAKGNNNDVSRPSASMIERGTTLPHLKAVEKKHNTSTIDKRPSVPITRIMGKRLTLPDTSTMHRNLVLRNASIADKRPGLTSTIGMDKAPTCASNASTVDKKPTSFHTRTTGSSRPTLPKRIDQNARSKDNGATQDDLRRDLGNDVSARKSKVLEEKRPNLERFPPTQLASKKLGDKSKISTLQKNLHVGKVFATHIPSAKGNIASSMHAKEKSMP